MSAAVKVRIDYEDGTFRELVGKAACKAWEDMAYGQAAQAFAHGVQFAPLPWRGTATHVTEGNPPSKPTP